MSFFYIELCDIYYMNYRIFLTDKTFLKHCPDGSTRFMSCDTLYRKVN